MGFPLILAEIRFANVCFPTDFRWRIATKRCMNAISVVIGAKLFELFLQITRIPEEDVIKVFTTNPPDRSFDEGM